MTLCLHSVQPPPSVPCPPLCVPAESSRTEPNRIESLSGPLDLSRLERRGAERKREEKRGEMAIEISDEPIVTLLYSTALRGAL